MNVLAIDPGPKESALILWDGEAVLSGVIRPNEQLLAEELPMLLLSKTQRPELLAIEQIRGYGMTAGNELFDSVWWTGRFYERQTNESFAPGIPRALRTSGDEITPHRRRNDSRQ